MSSVSAMPLTVRASGACAATHFRNKVMLLPRRLKVAVALVAMTSLRIWRRTTSSFAWASWPVTSQASPNSATMYAHCRKRSSRASSSGI
eukprot:519124-Alexandrium_andersonii.AAC.1